MCCYRNSAIEEALLARLGQGPIIAWKRIFYDNSSEWTGFVYQIGENQAYDGANPWIERDYDFTHPKGIHVYLDKVDAQTVSSYGSLFKVIAVECFLCDFVRAGKGWENRKEAVFRKVHISDLEPK